MIQAFKNARQLDTRHTVLEWIVREFYQESITQRFLDELASDEKEVFQLRVLAQNVLEQVRYYN